jgi:hypothetical protein
MKNFYQYLETITKQEIKINENILKKIKDDYEYPNIKLIKWDNKQDFYDFCLKEENWVQAGRPDTQRICFLTLETEDYTTEHHKLYVYTCNKTPITKELIDDLNMFNEIAADLKIFKIENEKIKQVENEWAKTLHWIYANVKFKN